jgi:hypothetical protein
VKLYAALALAACSSPPPQVAAPDAAPDAARDAAIAPPLPLEVDALGVQGFVLRHGNDVVMTAPLFTRQSALEVALNFPLPADVAAIDSGLAAAPLDKLVAVISGHAHYDHLLDVPRVLELAPHATLYTNATGRHILAALSPPCTSPGLARDRVVAMDDALDSHVDYTNCPDQRPPGAPLVGTWDVAPGGRVRVMAFCSMHPAQIGPYHFGLGSIDTDQCPLPAPASGWLEGQTLAFLIDFLDDAGAPALRVFYQDAPTNMPIGDIPAAALADKPVDLALLCAGSADAVTDHPGEILANLQPRYAYSGHWEDFFQPTTAPIVAQPLLDVPGYVARAEAALPGRHVLVTPGMHLVVPPP